MELTDELDLHTFLPKDVPELIPDYIDECVSRGYRQVRIIHGKGKGVLRRIVHAALERHPAVVRYELAGVEAGGWGATLAVLKPAVKECWPAPERNKEPIASALEALLPERGLLLEVASGSGQHVAHLAARFPGLEFQPSDVTDEHFTSVRAWTGELGNVREPLLLDAAAPESWPELDPAAIFCANMVHIAPWQACEGLMRGAARVLSSGGRLFLYGPFIVDGIETAPSNLEFDDSLRRRDPDWGVRRLADIEAVTPGLRRTRVIPMPANNCVVVFDRAG